MPDLVPFEIILRTPWAGPWRRFSRPFQVIAAHDRLDVRDALAQVDQAVHGGRLRGRFRHLRSGWCLRPPGPAGRTRSAAPLFRAVRAGAGRVADPLSGRGLRIPGRLDGVDRSRGIPASDSTRSRASIEAGDTYQINFTFRLTAPFEGDPAALMRDLYAGAGRAMECVRRGRRARDLFGVARAVLQPRRRAGRLPADEGHGAARLLGRAGRRARRTPCAQSEKNRAENVMIVDMVRNDIGRIARIGSVQATSLFEVERYPLQWQMTSTVEGGVETRSLLRLFEAMFPSGSITGAPKHSSMGIIRELETTPRGIYTGAIGYMSPRGRAHFNVAIRIGRDRSAARDRRVRRRQRHRLGLRRPRRVRRVPAQGARHRLGRDPDAALCLVCDQRAARLSVAGDDQVDTRRRVCAARPAHRANLRVRDVLRHPV